jgi:hypothetical protein
LGGTNESNSSLDQEEELISIDPAPGISLSTTAKIEDIKLKYKLGEMEEIYEESMESDRASSIVSKGILPKKKAGLKSSGNPNFDCYLMSSAMGQEKKENSLVKNLKLK